MPRKNWDYYEFKEWSELHYQLYALDRLEHGSDGFNRFIDLDQTYGKGMDNKFCLIKMADELIHALQCAQETLDIEEITCLQVNAAIIKYATANDSCSEKNK